MAAESNRPPIPSSTWVALGSLFLAEGAERGLAEGCWEGPPHPVPLEHSCLWVVGRP